MKVLVHSAPVEIGLHRGEGHDVVAIKNRPGALQGILNFHDQPFNDHGVGINKSRSYRLVMQPSAPEAPLRRTRSESLPIFDLRGLGTVPIPSKLKLTVSAEPIQKRAVLVNGDLSRDDRPVHSLKPAPPPPVARAPFAAPLKKTADVPGGRRTEIKDQGERPRHSRSAEGKAVMPEEKKSSEKKQSNFDSAGWLNIAASAASLLVGLHPDPTIKKMAPIIGGIIEGKDKISSLL